MLSPRAICLSLIFLISSTSSFAQDIPFNLDNLIACQAIQSDSDRLTCFDKNVRNFSIATEKGEIVTIEKETVREIERDSFGFNLPSVPKLSGLFGLSKKNDGDTRSKEATEGEAAKNAAVETVDRSGKVKAAKSKKTRKKNKNSIREAALNSTQQVSLKINRVGTFDHGKLKFLFENGQIWEQVDSEKLPKIKLSGNKNVSVEISKGTLGSFFLRVNGKGRAIKVRRTR